MDADQSGVQLGGGSNSVRESDLLGVGRGKNRFPLELEALERFVHLRANPWPRGSVLRRVVRILPSSLGDSIAAALVPVKPEAKRLLSEDRLEDDAVDLGDAARC